MKTNLDRVSELKRRHTGVVIPVYLPQDADPSVGVGAVRDTVRAFAGEVDDPTLLCLSVDGPGPAEEMCDELTRELGVSGTRSGVNRGKLSALRSGVARLLDRQDVHYVVAVDQDGDHFPNELLNFVRAARHVESVTGSDHVLVLGRRISRHRPMGFCRGELEEFADRVLLDALQYRAAATGVPLPLQFALTLDEFPDFHSGYKLFARATAEAVFLGEPDLCGVSPDGYYRHGCEAVMTVEALESGAVLSVINRSTFDEQPISMFGLLDRQRLVADKIIWPCMRLGVPPEFVQQWMRNHLPRIRLGTLLPDGKEELLGIRRLVEAGVGASPNGAEGGEIPRMPFV